jgi:hypothetical protein
MKTLLIKSTTLPSGERITWKDGMPVHKTRELHSDQFNQWHFYIQNEIIKMRMWTKIIRKISTKEVLT